jgi:hypothetical protein
VLWQQNIEFTRQLERLGSEISSAIRELPYAMVPMETEIEVNGVTDVEHTDQKLAEAESQMINAQYPALAHEPQVTGTAQGDSRQRHATKEVNDEMIFDRSTQSMSYQEIHGGMNIDLILQEMRRQTLLLEQLLRVQRQHRTAHRLERSTQEIQIASFSLDDPFES